MKLDTLGLAATTSLERLGRLVGSSKWLSRVLFLVASILVVILYASRIGHTVYNNDWLHVMGGGYALGGEHYLIEQFAKAAERNCLSLGGAGLEREVEPCLLYQNVVRQKTWLSHPIYGFLGRSLESTDLSVGPVEFARGVQNAIVTAGWLSIFFLVAFLAISVRAIGADVRLAILVLLVGGLFFRGAAYGFSINIVEGGVSYWEAVVVGMLFCLAAVMVRSVEIVGKPSSAPGDWLRNPLFAIGMLCFALLVASAGHFPSEFIYPRQQSALVLGVLYAAYVANPNTRMIWFLPLALLFHVPTAIVATFSLLLAEGTVSIMSRSVSRLLLSSSLTVCLGVVFVKLFWSSGLEAPNVSPLGSLLEKLVVDGRFVVSLIVSAVVFAVGIYILRRPVWSSRASLGLARSCFLLAQIIMASQISAIVKADPDWLAPGKFFFAALPDYLAPPALLFISIGAILVGVVGEKKVVEEPNRWAFLLAPSAMAVFCVLLTATKLAPLQVNRIRDAGDQALFYGVGRNLHPSFGRMVERLAPGDNVYFLPASQPTNHPLIYYSLLKLKIRISRGVASDGFRIEVVK